MEVVNLTILDKNNNKHEVQLPNDESYNLMELLRAAEFPILGTCGGIALCASCHIYVLSDHKLPLATEDEERLLATLFNSTDKSRLSCQLRMNDGIDQLVIQIAAD